MEKKQILKIRNEYANIQKTSEKIGSGKFLKIEIGKYMLHNGEEVTREKIKKKYTKAAIIVPITAEGNIIMVIQPRPIIKERASIEFPAGYVEDGEKPEIAAFRELQEETGYTSNEIIKITEYYPDEGCMETKNHLFICMNCTKTHDQSLDGDEYITVIETTFDTAVELLNEGHITGVNSQLGLISAKKYIKEA